MLKAAMNFKKMVTGPKRRQDIMQSTRETSTPSGYEKIATPDGYNPDGSRKFKYTEEKMNMSLMNKPKPNAGDIAAKFQPSAQKSGKSGLRGLKKTGGTMRRVMQNRLYPKG